MRRVMDLPRLKVAASHLAQEDADLLCEVPWEGIMKVIPEEGNFTISMVGVWDGMVKDAEFEVILGRLADLGYSECFIEAMRFARREDAWEITFHERAHVHPALPIGGYEKGSRLQP